MRPRTGINFLKTKDISQSAEAASCVRSIKWRTPACIRRSEPVARIVLAREMRAERCRGSRLAGAFAARVFGAEATGNSTRRHTHWDNVTASRAYSEREPWWREARLRGGEEPLQGLSSDPAALCALARASRLIVVRWWALLTRHHCRHRIARRAYTHDTHGAARTPCGGLRLRFSEKTKKRPGSRAVFDCATRRVAVEQSPELAQQNANRSQSVSSRSSCKAPTRASLTSRLR